MVIKMGMLFLNNAIKHLSMNDFKNVLYIIDMFKE